MYNNTLPSENLKATVEGLNYFNGLIVSLLPQYINAVTPFSNTGKKVRLASGDGSTAAFSNALPKRDHKITTEGDKRYYFMVYCEFTNYQFIVNFKLSINSTDNANNKTQLFEKGISIAKVENGQFLGDVDTLERIILHHELKTDYTPEKLNDMCNKFKDLKEQANAMYYAIPEVVRAVEYLHRTN